MEDGAVPDTDHILSTPVIQRVPVIFNFTKKDNSAVYVDTINYDDDNEVKRVDMGSRGDVIYGEDSFCPVIDPNFVINQSDAEEFTLNFNPEFLEPSFVTDLIESVEV